MEDDPNISSTEQNAKHATASGIPTNDHTSRSDKPCSHKMNSRNLIVCIDGTANQFGAKNTNVIELYNLILKEDEHNQRTWYNSGIGTYARPSWKSFKYYHQVLSHKIDLAIAWNFERTILAAYRWLSDNYQSGDCIYLFGFSRGAYQVRVLSAMIDRVGLIYKGNETQIPFAYELYSDPKSHSHEATRVGASGTQDQNKMTMAERFKKAFSYKDVTVHFVGAWDTVSSIGIARGKKMLPGTVDGMKHVCYFRHALALDERRVKFLPEYACGGTSIPQPKIDSPVNHEPPHKDNSGKTNDIISNNESLEDGPPVSNQALLNRPQARIKSTENRPHTIEVWFAGTHSDIGGGNVANVGMDRSRPPLRWMVFEAGALGLRTAPFERELLPGEQIHIKESLTPLWWPLELCPFSRLTYTRKEKGKNTTHKPHLGSSRKIHPGHKIHSSLTLSNDTNYTPKARPFNDDSNFWNQMRKKGLGDWVAIDLYEYTENLLERLITENPDAVLKTLRQTAVSADGRQAVYEGVIGALKKLGPEDRPEDIDRLLRSAMDILDTSTRGGTSLKRGPSNEILPFLSILLESDVGNYRKVAQQFLLEFAVDGHQAVYDRVITALKKKNLAPEDTGRLLRSEMEVLEKSTRGGTSLKLARSVDICPLLSKLVKNDIEIVRQFLVEFTDRCIFELRGCSLPVNSVAFSPDGTRIVSGSDDETIRIWDATTGKKVGEPFRGHTNWVSSVAFSPDGMRIVSGSHDATIRIWDGTTGKQVGEPLRGHAGVVLSVAFSPDGTRIGSGSADETIRIWDANTGKQVGEPFRGHTNLVTSVAFSPDIDGTRIVSGSWDDTIRIWDARTGVQVGEPFRGHTNWASSVAFSPDGTRIVSGSLDETIRIWDAKTGKQVGEPFRGHISVVWSVAFSPDGTRIVSGSADKTIRIWDAKTGQQVGEPFRVHANSVLSVAFSPDGMRIVSGSDDETIRIWDAESAETFTML